MARLILVADDSPSIQRRAQGILQGEGFEVETVSNGVAAIKKLPKLQPILVLADVSMPGKDGYEVCEFVKSSPELRHVPVLLVGSDLEPYDEQRGAQVGADGIIKKPFSPHDLIGAVAKFVGLAETPVSQPTLPYTLVTSSPAATPEVPPSVSAPEPSTGSQERDLAALRAGAAFEGALNGEMPTTPAEFLPDVFFQPSPESALQVSPPSLPEPVPAAPPEDLLPGSSEPSPVASEPFPGFALGRTPEPTPEPGFEDLPWSALVSPEPISEPAPQATPEPSLVTSEPTPEAAPGSALVSPELISETVAEATPNQELVAAEPAAESALPVTPESVTETLHLPAEAAPETPPAVPVEEVPPPAEPLAAETQAEPIPSLPPSPAHVTEEADRTVAFRVPAEIAEAGLISEPAPAPPAPEAPSLVEAQSRKPMAATHLDSFSLAEAAEGQVYVAPPETEAGLAPEAEVARPGGAPAGALSMLDPDWVYIIVHKTVTKMAPPALSPEQVEELVQTLTREIIAELDAASSRAY